MQGYTRTAVIFAAREKPDQIVDAISCVDKASLRIDSKIHVLVNGNSPLSEALAGSVAGEGIKNSISIWDIPFGDKSNAWNQYLHKIHKEEDVAVFIDGYVRVYENSLDELSDSLVQAPDSVYAASGVPTVGPSAESNRGQMLREGGIHGNLCALRFSAIDQFRRRGIRLPFQMYRTDPTLAAFMCFNFYPAKYQWNTRHILVNPNATWDRDEPRITSVRDIRDQVARFLRQGRGHIENKAVHDLLAIKKIELENFPPYANKMCVEWIDEHKGEFFKMLFRRPWIAWAAYNLRRAGGVQPKYAQG